MDSVFGWISSELLYLLVGLGLGLGVALGVYRFSRRQLPPAQPSEKKQVEGQGAPKGLPSGVQAPGEISPKAGPTQATPPTAPTSVEPAEKSGFFQRLVAGLSRTQGQLVERLDSALRGRKEIDETLYEELESILLGADVGVKTTHRLLEQLKNRATREDLKNPAALRGYLQDEIRAILKQGHAEIRVDDHKPMVILIIGVNGVGKTTTIGKLASLYSKAGKKVIMAAGDTFRAAAIEQLEIWADRAGAEIVKNKEGSDPSAVIFDAITAAKSRGADVVIADTAGRLHTKANLMEELKKVARVANKALPGAPHETLLVLDSTMGQNAFNQARIFHEGCTLTGLVLTKLDGTAKGGVIIGICDELRLPVKFIGVGEKVDDLQPFDPDQFVSALF